MHSDLYKIQEFKKNKLHLFHFVPQEDNCWCDRRKKMIKGSGMPKRAKHSLYVTYLYVQFTTLAISFKSAFAAIG